MEALQKLLAAPDLCSKRWIWEQYDHMVMANTVQPPGGDAAVVRVHGTRKGLALTADCTPRYCAADPASGGAQAVAEAWRNLTAVGARPLAITDCLNFGNPERPSVMGQFAGCIEGMAEACRALDFPVVSGNVSFYNETEGAGILPTPSIGGLGLIADLERMCDPALKALDETLLLVGGAGGHLARSLYQREIEDREEGPPPAVDLAAERRHGDFVRRQIETGRGLRLPRHLRWRPPGGARRDGAGGARRRPHHRRPDRRSGRHREHCRLALRRGSGAVPRQRAPASRRGARGGGGA